MSSIRDVQQAVDKFDSKRDVLVCYGVVDGKKVQFGTNILSRTVREGLVDHVESHCMRQ